MEKFEFISGARVERVDTCGLGVVVSQESKEANEGRCFYTVAFDDQVEGDVMRVHQGLLRAPIHYADESQPAWIATVTARFRAKDEVEARRRLTAIYNMGGPPFLLNPDDSTLELIGGGYSEEKRNEAREALQAIGIESPSRIIIERACLLIESAREAIGNGEAVDSAISAATQEPVTYTREALAMADDTPELYNLPAKAGEDGEASAVDVLRSVVNDTLRSAVAHAVALA